MSAISAIKQMLEDGFAQGDEASLLAFYDALLAGELLVAVGGGETALTLTIDGRRVELGGSRDAEGNAILAAFTGDQELEAWAGWGVERLAVWVPALATAALDAEVETLSLNPAGPVGRHVAVVELRQLATGVVPRSGRASFGFEPRSGLAVAAPATGLAPVLVDALRAVCARIPEIGSATLVELMEPRRGPATHLAVALELAAPADRARRSAIVELIGAAVTETPAAGLAGVGFLWLDARLAALVGRRARPEYVRPGPSDPAGAIV